MTTSVKFCISYDLLKCGLIAFEMNIISLSKRIVDTGVISDVACTRQSVITRVDIRFYDTTSTE